MCSNETRLMCISLSWVWGGGGKRHVGPPFWGFGRGHGRIGPPPPWIRQCCHPSYHVLYHCVGRLWCNSEEARTESFKSLRSHRVLCPQIRACLPTTWGASVGVSRHACVWAGHRDDSPTVKQPECTSVSAKPYKLPSWRVRPRYSGSCHWTAAAAACPHRIGQTFLCIQSSLAV